MDKTIIYTKISGAVTVIFFITSTASAAPPTHYKSTLRPASAIHSSKSELEQELQEHFKRIPPVRESVTKLAIFDWGKVVGFYDYRRSAKLLAERFGVDEDLAFQYFEERNTNPDNPVYQYEHGQIDGRQLTEATITWLKKNTGREDIMMTVAEFEEIFVSTWDDKPFPEVISLIKDLREKGYRVCILSTSNDIHYRHFMKHFFPLLGINKDDIFASHLTKVAKPEMESYLQVVRHAGVSPENALFIDDRQDCIDGAKRAGLKAFLFNPQDPLGSVEDIVTTLSVASTLPVLPAIPQVKSADRYLAELENRFSLPLADMQKIKTGFAGHIKAALSGRPTAFDIYKAYIGTPTGQETGRYMRLEVGGSKIYIGMVELKGNRKYEIFRDEFSFTIPEEIKRGKGTVFFDFIAECISKFLKKYEESQGTGDRYELGFIFSFAMKKTGIDKATVVETSKEYKLEEVIGGDPKALLIEALKRKKITNIDIIAVGNDTEALEAGASYLYKFCTEALILSTGYNIPIHTKGDIFNTEAGNWSDEYFSGRRTQFDEAIDLNSLNQGHYLVEKRLSGQYLGEITRRVLYDMISQGLLFKGESNPVFNMPWQFEAEYLDNIEKYSLEDLAGVKEFLIALGIKNVSDKDSEVVWRVSDMVTTRAAKLVAIALAAAIKNTDPNLERKHIIPAEGSLYEFHSSLKHKINNALVEIFKGEASKIKLVLNREVTKIGGAVMAAMAKKAKSSSGGSVSVQEVLKPSDTPIIFNVTSIPISEPALSDYTEFRKDLLRRHGFYPSSFVENFQTCRDAKGQEYVLKPDASKEALAYYFARAVGFDDISKALLFIAPDGMYASGLVSYGLIEYYNGITFSKTDKRFPRITIDSKLYKEHPKLRDLDLEGIDFEAWFKVLQDPAQIVSGDLFRIFSNNLESTWARNLIYKKLDNDKVEIRFIDYQPAFADKGFDEKEVISHLKKYTSYYLKYCPELLMNIVNLSDTDIEYIVRWVYRQELLNVRIAVARPEELIKNIKDSRDLIKEVLGEEIIKIKVTGETVATVSTVTRPTEQLRDLHMQDITVLSAA